MSILVEVIDSEGRIVDRVTPAHARVALKHGYVSPIPNSQPFRVRVTDDANVARLSSLTRNSKSASVEVTRVEKRHSGATASPTPNAREQMSNYDFISAMENTNAFFDAVEKTDKGVWAKSIAKKGRQVVIEVALDNNKRFKIPPIVPGDPVCLSKYAPFHALKNCQDLLQLAGTSIKLMTTAEARKYFDTKANLLKRTPAEVRAEAEAKERAFMRREKALSKADAESHLADLEPEVSEDDLISPQVLELVAEIGGPVVVEVGPGRRKVDDSKRLPAAQVLSRLFEIQESLTQDDLLYIETRGYWPSVKKWAREQIATLVTLHSIDESESMADDLEEMEPEPEPIAPPKKKRGRPRKQK